MAVDQRSQAPSSTPGTASSLVFYGAAFVVVILGSSGAVFLASAFRYPQPTISSREKKKAISARAV